MMMLPFPARLRVTLFTLTLTLLSGCALIQDEPAQVAIVNPQQAQLAQARAQVIGARQQVYSSYAELVHAIGAGLDTPSPGEEAGAPRTGPVEVRRIEASGDGAAGAADSRP